MVKALDLKSNGFYPRRFKSCCCRLLFFLDCFKCTKCCFNVQHVGLHVGLHVQHVGLYVQHVGLYIQHLVLFEQHLVLFVQHLVLHVQHVVLFVQKKYKPPTGVEPVTSRLLGECSNQLSYKGIE